MKIFIVALLLAIGYAQTAEVAEHRHPAIAVLCASQPQETCYGKAAGVELDGGTAACAWHPTQLTCVVVTHEQEPSEDDQCKLKRYIPECIGFASQEAQDIICAWDPTYTHSCAGGVIEPIEEGDPGSHTGMMNSIQDTMQEGMDPATYHGTRTCVQMGMSGPNGCKSPCMWVGGNPGFCVHNALFQGGSLRTIHKTPETRQYKLFLFVTLALMAGFGLPFGLSYIINFCRKEETKACW